MHRSMVSLGWRLGLTALAIAGCLWCPRAAYAAGLGCPDVGGALRRDPSRDVRATNSDGSEALSCGYQLTDAYAGPLGGRSVRMQWVPAGTTAQDPQFCSPLAFNQLGDPTKAAFVNFGYAGHNVPELRQVARGMLAEVLPLAAPCPSAAGAKHATVAPALAPTKHTSSDGFDPIAGLAAAGVVAAGVITLGVRTVRRKGRPEPPPAPEPAIYDGQPATDLLVRQGWLTPVPRPDGSIGYRPTGDLNQFLTYDHGGWQPPFASGTVGPDGNALHQLVGVAFTPNADGLLDSVTLVASTTPPAPVPAPGAALPSPLVPAAAPPGSDLGSQLLLDPAGEFVDLEHGGYEHMAVPLLLKAIVDINSAPTPPTALAGTSPAAAATAPSAPPVAAPASVPAPSPVAALFCPSGGSVTVTAADLSGVAPTWIAPDGTIAPNRPFAGVKPVVTFGDGTINVRVAFYRATARLVNADGRVVLGVPTVHGPGADFIDADDVRAKAQALLDQTINRPGNGNGLRITDAHVAGDGIHLATAPIGP